MRRFYLFGHPLHHSVSPPIHRAIWAQLGVDDCTFENQTTEGEDGFARMGRTLRSDDFGGASVTMPAKFAVLKYVDEVARDCQLVGSCNCVYVDELGRRIGTNVDWIGIRHALLGVMPLNEVETHSSQPAFEPSRTAGFVLGAGGATRASVYALHTLGIGRIFVVNRDAAETAALVAHFASVGIVVAPVERAADVDGLVGQLAAEGRRICCAAAAIPVLPITTAAEREVYAIAEALFAVVDSSPRYFCDRASCRSDRL